MYLIDEFRKSWLTSLIGFALAIVGTLVLFWNEGRAVKVTISLQEALDQVITVSSEKPFDKSMEGRIVHISGPLMTGEPLTEMDYNIMVQAVKLKRRVQMYQWVEETLEHSYGESLASVQAEDRTYFYTQEFKDELIDSRGFYMRHGHENPSKFPMESRTYIAEHVTIGAFEIGDEVKGRMNTFIEVTSDSRPDDPSIKMHSGMYYHCNDVFSPEIGDLRIHFSFAGLQGEYYTVIGLVKTGKIVPYRSISGKKRVLIVQKGEVKLDDAFRQEHKAQRMTTWGFRFVGFVIVFFAVTCTSHLLTILLTGNILTAQLAPDPENLVSSNLAVAFSASLMITSVAWIVHRPWLGASLLCTAIAPAFFRRQNIRYQRID